MTEISGLINFVLDQAENAPVRKRIFLYRDLAKICRDATMAADFCAMADDLEEADNNCREFRFRLETFGKNQNK